MRTTRMLLTALVAVSVLAMLGGCSPSPPKDAPSISGVIATVTPGYGSLGTILVEGSGEYDKASVTISASTTMLREVEGGYERATFEDLQAGMAVDVWFTGPVAESYPVQASAKALTVR